MGRAGRFLAALLVFAAAFALVSRGAGEQGLLEPSEGRYGSIAAAMVRSGDLVVPRLNGRVHLEKPPFATWLMAAALRTCGQSEGALRLPSLLSGATCVLCAYLLSGPGPSARAMLAAGMTAAAPLSFALARIATTDAVLAASVAVCLFFACRHLDLLARGRRAGTCLSLAALASAVGFMTKGPVVWLFTLVPVLLEGLWSRRPGHVRRVLAPGRVLLFCAVAVPWFLAVEQRVPGSLGWLVRRRAAAALVSSESFHPGPWCYFVPVFLGGLFPAGLLLPCSRPAAWREVLADPARRLLALAAAVPLIVLSLSASKLATYLLPAAVPVAVLAAALLGRGRGRGGVLACCAALATAFVGAWLAPPVREKLAGAPIGVVGAAALAAVTAFVAAPFAAYSVLALGTRTGLALLLGAQLLILLLLARMANGWDNGIGRHGTARDLALQIRARRLPDEGLLCFRTQVFSLPFYLGQDVATTEPHAEFGKGSAPGAPEPSEELAAVLRRGAALVICRGRNLPELEDLAPGARVLWKGPMWSLVRAPPASSEPPSPPYH